MTAAQRKSRSAGDTAEAADHEGAASEAYDHPAGKATLTKSDVARRLSIWLDCVYDNDAVPASGFKLMYRIAKRCRATFSREGKVHSFEGKESLAASVGISQKQVWNLLNIVVEQKLLRIVRRGKGLTNLLVPVLSDRQSISDHNPAGDRQSIADQDALVTGNQFPSDRKSISDVTGNGFPIHIDEGLERRVVAEGGEGFKPSPSPSNTRSLSGSDAHRSASGHDPACKFKIGDQVELSVDGDDLIRSITDIGTDASGSAFIKVRAEFGFGDADWVVPIDNAGRLRHRDGWWEHGRPADTETVHWSIEIDNPAPKARRKRDAAA